MKPLSFDPSHRKQIQAIAATIFLCGGLLLGDGLSQLPVGKAAEPKKNTRIEFTKAQKVKRLERVKLIRAKWRPWALAHKTELQKVLDVATTDREALQTVWNVLPTSPTKEKPFSWNPLAKPCTTQQAEYVKRDFNKLRDIQLTRSIKAGRAKVCMWTYDFLH